MLGTAVQKGYLTRRTLLVIGLLVVSWVFVGSRWHMQLVDVHVTADFLQLGELT